MNTQSKVRYRSFQLRLTPKIQSCKEPLRSQEVGNALYGLQRLGDSREMRALLTALTPKIEECREDLRAQEIGNGLYGLQHLSDSEELLRLTAALALVERFDIEPFSDFTTK